MWLFLYMALQIIPQVPLVDLPPGVGGEIVGPYIFREDVGQTTKVILKNGLTVIVREENAVPLVSITTLVKAGYFDEPDEISGISHVIEHMFFKGTERRGVGEIARETKALGGSLNAATHYERTVYHAVTPAANAVAALEIQADALWNPAFDAGELAREIEVVLQENNRKLDNPMAVVVERLYGAAFAQHRMGRWRIGSPEGLRALTRDDLVDYYDRYYQPSNVILVLAGRFEREAMLAEVVRLYGEEEDVAVERPERPGEPPQTEFRHGAARSAAELAYVALGYHTPSIHSGDAYVLEALAALLTSGRASRFNWFLRDEQGVVSQAESAYLGFQDLGYFQISLQTGDAAAAALAALAELQRIREHGVSAEALQRAKALIAEGYYRRLETLESLGVELAVAESQGDWKRVFSFLDGIDAIEAADVQRVVNAHLTPGNLTVFDYVAAAEPRLPTREEFAAAVLARTPTGLLERSIEPLPVAAAVPRTDAGLVVDLVRPPVRRSILRGPDVYILEDHRLPLVTFGVFYPGGRLDESAENAGITELMLRSALRGTRRFNAADIARRLENAGARIEVVSEPDMFGYVLEGLAGSMETALEILMEVLQEPTFLEDPVEQERALQRARLQQLRHDNLRHPVQLFMSSLFGAHAYAHPAGGYEESLAVITADDLEAWHRRQARFSAPVIVIVGATNGTGLVASVAESLTNVDLEAREIRTVPAPAPAVERRETVHETDRRQSALVYGWMGPSLAGADRLPLTVIQHALSGLGGRLFEAIRETRGLAYTVSAFTSFLARSGAFYAYTAFSPENEAEVTAALEAEIRRFVAEGLTAEELEKAVNYSVGAHEQRLQSRRERSLAIARSVIGGAGIDAVTGYSDALRRLAPADVRAAAEAYLAPARATVTVVRGR